MHGPVSQLVAWPVAIGLPWLICRFRGRPDLAILTGILNVLTVSTALLLDPSAEARRFAALIGGLIVLNLALRLAPARVELAIVGAARRRAAKIVLACLAATLIPLALVECICRVLTECDILEYHKGIQTVWRPTHDDWRLATITGDESREPDPVLLWRPVPRRPFTAQRFKGPLAEIPKPPDVVRVMCYGDSLTDGPPMGGWPTWLQKLLVEEPPGVPGRRFEVLNAGVAGYSSHQGIQRFLQEVDRYTPDLVLVSFGWNDAADAGGQPDKSYKIPPWPVVAFQRALIRYRTYLVLMYYTQQWRPRPAVASGRPAEHRVSIEGYLANLDLFQREAQARGISIAFLTRPHKVQANELRKNPTWRGAVPDYNAALVKWARENRAVLLDVQGTFANLPQSLFSDECHFTREGYELMGRLVLKQLARLPDNPIGQTWLAAGIKVADDPEVLRR